MQISTEISTYQYQYEQLDIETNAKELADW